MGSVTARTRGFKRGLALIAIVSAVLACTVLLPAAASAALMVDGVRPAAVGDTYTITLTVTGSGGQVTPGTSQTVNYRDNCTFYITAASGYHPVVTVDGGLRDFTGQSSVMFSNVAENHTLDVVFAKDTFPIEASAGPGGSISPSGTVPVEEGSDAIFTITPAPGRHVADVLVDDASVGAVTSYKFTNVQAGHTISATFALNACTITPYAGPHGTISPATTLTVTPGADATFTITAASGYHVSDVFVDAASVGAVSTYTFHNVTGSHSIAAIFEVNPVGTHTITASAGAGGAIAPSGARVVTDGTNATFTITPNTGFHVQDVLVDGGSVGAVGSYTFTVVSGDHTIAASFAVDSTDVAAPQSTCDAVTSYVGTATIHITAADEAGGSGVRRIWYRLDGGPAVEGTAPTTSVPGQHALEYWAEDYAGNIETHHTLSFTVTISGASVATTTTIEPRLGLNGRLRKPFVISGVLKGGKVGDMVVVMVKKPGKSYWSYSSARLCYALNAKGEAMWWYRYTPLLRGTYSFFALCPASPGYVTSRSAIIAVRVR
jgi:hypothetical protein